MVWVESEIGFSKNCPKMAKFFCHQGLLTRERSFALANNSLSSESEQIDPARFKFRGFGEPVEESRSEAFLRFNFKFL